MKLLSSEWVEIEGGEDALPYQSLVYLLGTLKNLTNEEKARLQAPSLVIPVAQLLPSVSAPLPLDYINNSRAQVLIQVTGILRNYAGDSTSVTDMLRSKVVERGLRTLDLFFEHSELIFNTCRVLSKLSVDSKCCQLMLDKENLYSGVGVLQRVMLAYSEQPAVVSRVGFTLANLSMMYAEARAVIGAEGFDAITDAVLLPYTHIDTPTKPQFDALLKTVRLLANIVLDTETGVEMMKGATALTALTVILELYTGKHEEMTLITVSCIANILFYDLPSSPICSDAALHGKLIRLLAPCLVQTDNFEITREALRAISNLTRHENAISELHSIHAIEPLILLLDHNIPEIVFFSLGCLTNISHLAKELVNTGYCFERLTTLMGEAGLRAVDVSMQVGMVLANLCAPTKGMVPWEGVAGEEVVRRLSHLVNTLLAEAGKKEETEELVTVLTTLKDMMPKDLLPCPFPGCGRKFPSQEKLNEHWDRRHSE